MEELSEILGDDLAREYDPKKSCNFSQVVATLYSSISMSLALDESADEQIKYLKNYAGLIREFPEFRDNEMQTIEKTCGDACKHIDDHYKRLKGKPLV